MTMAKKSGHGSSGATPTAPFSSRGFQTRKNDYVNKVTIGYGRTGAGARQLGTPERILIVDDAEVVREFVFTVLTAAGYDCRTVSSGFEALALLKAGEQFDLLICDLLNKPHGITLLERTKKRYPTIRVIIATAPCCVCTARFAINAMGASDYLVKPFQATKLLTTVWRTLAGRSIMGAPPATASSLS